MSDLELLFLVLVAFYGWECLCWIRRGAVAFSNWSGRAWRLRHPGNLLGNQRGGFIGAAPLPPLGTILTANPLPLSISPEGALVWVSTNVSPGWRPAQSGRFARWEDIREVRAQGKKLIVNGELWLRAGSASHARHLADVLHKVSSLSGTERVAGIRSIISDSLDPKAIEQRLREFTERTRRLRWLSNGLFVYLLLLAPAVIWTFGLTLSWSGLLVGLVALTGSTAFLFRRAHRALYPRDEDERFSQTLMVFLWPHTAIRARDLLSRPLVETSHPLAVAKRLLPEHAFREFGRRVLLDLRRPALPVCPADEAQICATERFARDALRDAAEKLVRQSGINPDELCRPPAPTDESCIAYCPRCGAQFTRADSRCADCGGMEVVTFGKTG